jgi:Phosphotransferase system, mannose/fructose/N-acetylgalactosamine-specific component IIB
MAIVFARIDNRLIHGQVVEGWLPSANVSDVVVVSDNAASSPLMGKMLRMSLPPDYKLNVLKVNAAAEYLQNNQNEKIFLLLENFSSLKTLVDDGVNIDTVNVGNTEYREGAKEYGHGVYLSAEEEHIVKDLLKKNVKFDVRALPSSFSTRLI